MIIESRLRFIKDAGFFPSGRPKCLFVCQCGKKVVVDKYAVKYGNTKSCGCLKREMSHVIRRTHGEALKTKEYNKWASMKWRCSTKKEKHFKDYLSRGIKVCDRWKNSFENFLKDMGRCPAGFTLERKDVDGNYCPKNCMWASMKTQQNNKRNNKIVNFNGECKTLAEWSFLTGIKYSLLWKRISRGWKIEDAFSKR